MQTAISTDISRFLPHHIEYLFSASLPGYLTYHNLDHTLMVVEAVKEIGKEEGLSQDEIEILEIAAWFHDSGHTVQADGHEQHSAQIARTFLTRLGYDDQKTEDVISLILATRWPHKPVNLLEKVICDADLKHLATRHFKVMSNRLRTEWEALGKKYSDKEWLMVNRLFFSQHKFFTEYGKDVLEDKKRKTLLIYLS
jgi:predicted metal-dependent HD superfamily phosphohydrolase